MESVLCGTGSHWNWLLNWIATLELVGGTGWWYWIAIVSGTGIPHRN